MRLLLVAPRAVLLPLGPLGVLPPVLRREVVPAFAHRAFHDDVFARHLYLCWKVGMMECWKVISHSNLPTSQLSALFQNLRHHTGTDRSSTLTDGKPQLLFHRDRRDQLDRHLRVVARHHHLDPRRQLRSEEHTSELQSPCNLVCRLLLEKKKKKIISLTQHKTKKKKKKKTLQ